MQPFMNPKWLFSVGTVLVATVIGIGLLFTGSEPVYAQGPDNRPIPDMLGVWDGELSFCFFQDVDSGGPSCLEGDPAEPFRITHQLGNSFAGRAGLPEFPHAPGRLTGVVLPDGQVRIQSYEGGLRMFYTGTVTVRGGTYELVGVIQAFDDRFEGSDNVMATGTFFLTKVY